jgi:hypothetical protein
VTEAADVLKRLPEERMREYFSALPDVVYSFADMVGQEPKPMRRPPPPPAAISRMEKTLTWMQFLAPDDARLLWTRAEGLLGRRSAGASASPPGTAHRRWQYGISVIALRLSGTREPRLCRLV